MSNRTLLEFNHDIDWTQDVPRLATLLDSVRRSIPVGVQKQDEETREALRRMGIEYVGTRHHSERCHGDEIDVLRDRIRLLEADRKKLIAAGRSAASALDTLMGDSDLDDDDSPEFKACQRMNKVLYEVSPKHARTT